MPGDGLCQISADCCDPGSELIQMKDRGASGGGRGCGEEMEEEEEEEEAYC